MIRLAAAAALVPALLCCACATSNSNTGGDSSQGSAESGQASADSSAGTAAQLNASADSTANSAEASLASTSQGLADSSAQSTRESSRVSGPLLSTTAVGSTVIGLGYLLWAGLTANAGAVPPAAPPAAPAAASYLRANDHQLRMDLALGAGPSVDDLAAMAEIRPEHRARFGELLRRHRSEILAWSDPRAITPELAARVLARIGELAAADPVLAADGRAFVERHRS